VTLAGSPDDEIYFGSLDAFASVIAHVKDDEPEQNLVEARLDEMWLPRDPSKFLGRLLGGQGMVTVGLLRLFEEFDLHQTDKRMARGRLRRALYFWSKAERTNWHLKTKTQSVWAIADAFVAYSTALEVVLGNNDRGSTVNALSGRAAALLSDDPEERLGHSKQVKELYGLRSGYVHAGEASMRRGELMQIRAVVQTCLLNFVRWIAARDAEELLHDDYLRYCELRVFGHRDDQDD
jgi:hypothetical protein